MSKYTWHTAVEAVQAITEPVRSVLSSRKNSDTDGTEEQPLLSASGGKKESRNGDYSHSVDIAGGIDEQQIDKDKETRNGSYQNQRGSHEHENIEESDEHPDTRERGDSWLNKEPRIHQQEYESMQQERGEEEREEDERITPYDRLPSNMKTVVNKKQKFARIASSSSYFLASVCVIVESALNFVCVSNECEKQKHGDLWHSVTLWWIAVCVGMGTGFLFAVGSIAHVVADRIDVQKEGGISRSRYDSMLAIISSWLTVLGSLGFCLGSVFELLNGVYNDGLYLLVGHILTVVGISFFFIGLLIERASVQMKLIDVIEAGKHDERDTILWSIAATMIFCQFEVLFLVGSIVDVYEDPTLTKMGHILWIVSGFGAVAGSLFEFTSNVKEKL